jgi:hypothetical protein
MKSFTSTTMLVAAATAVSVNGYSFVQPMRTVPLSIRNAGTSGLKMISTGDDRSERKSLDISKTMYTSLIKSPKDAYIAVRL